MPTLTFLDFQYQVQTIYAELLEGVDPEATYVHTVLMLNFMAGQMTEPLLVGPPAEVEARTLVAVKMGQILVALGTLAEAYDLDMGATASEALYEIQRQRDNA